MNAGRWTVARWMTEHPHTTNPLALALDAAEIMQDRRCRHVPVVDGDRVVGMVSDRDLRKFLPRRGLPPVASDALQQTLVRDLMSPMPFTVTADASLREAAELLCREKIGALPVLRHGKLVGIVTVEDLLWAFVENTGDAEYGASAASDDD